MTRRDSLTTLTLLTLALATALGCGGAPSDGGDAAAATDAGGQDETARTLPIPGGTGDGLPAGHPPLDGAGDGGAAAGGAVMVWDEPEGWTAVTPGSSMRYAQYSVPGPAGDGECIVYYFGPGQGGEPVPNAQRWAGQFTRPDGSSALPDMTMKPLEGAAVEVAIVEVEGTYDGGMSMTDAPAAPQPDSMLLGGIALGPDAYWFVKFTGPKETVEAQREAFLSMMRSMRAAG